MALWLCTGPHAGGHALGCQEAVVLDPAQLLPSGRIRRQWTQGGALCFVLHVSRPPPEQSWCAALCCQPPLCFTDSKRQVWDVTLACWVQECNYASRPCAGPSDCIDCGSNAAFDNALMCNAINIGQACTYNSVTGTCTDTGECQVGDQRTKHSAAGNTPDPSELCISKSLMH